MYRKKLYMFPYYLQFQASTEGLRLYPPQIRGELYIIFHLRQQGIQLLSLRHNSVTVHETNETFLACPCSL